MFLYVISNSMLISTEPQGLQDFMTQPTLLRYRAKYALDPESAMDLLCLLGMALSFLATISSEMRTSLVFLLLWALYLSLYSVGQVFLHFQWYVLYQCYIIPERKSNKIFKCAMFTLFSIICQRYMYMHNIFSQGHGSQLNGVWYLSACFSDAHVHD